MSEARITRHVSEHHAVQGEAEYVNRAAPERAETAPVAWTSLAALTAVSEGRSAWMFPAKEGDDLSGAIPLYTNPGAQTSELEAELARALAQIEDLEAECDRRHAALQGAPAPGIAEAAKVLLAARTERLGIPGDPGEEAMYLFRLSESALTPAPQAEGLARILCLPYPMHGYGVCIGGRYDGWLMWQHPDGQWVSKTKLGADDPAKGLPAALTPAPSAATPTAQEAVPVAWRCKDYADGWILYGNKAQAELYQACTGCLMEALYAHPPQPSVSVAEAHHVLSERLAHLDHLCATSERRGPSHKGYVTDATYHHWCGERSAIQTALRALKGGRDDE